MKHHEDEQEDKRTVAAIQELLAEKLEVVQVHVECVNEPRHLTFAEAVLTELHWTCPACGSREVKDFTIDSFYALATGQLFSSNLKCRKCWALAVAYLRLHVTLEDARDIIQDTFTGQIGQ